MRLKFKYFSSVIATLIIISAISIISIAYYFINIENGRANHFKSNLENINQLTQFNSKWASSVEDTRSFELRDFDQIALFTKKIRATLADLDASGLLDEKKSGNKTIEEYKIFKNSFEIKYEAIEAYKSEQAILRNSVNFLQTSVNDALANIENDSIKQEITTTASFINNFLLLNNELALDEAESHLSNLSTTFVDNESTLAKEAITTYISHAKIILEYKPRVVDMLASAKDVDIETLTKNVSSAYLSYQDISHERVSYWQKIMLAGAGGLLLTFLWFLNRFRKNSKRVQLTQGELEEANVKIYSVGEDIIYSERISGRALLALATIESIKQNTSPFKSYIDLLEKLIKTNDPQLHSNELSQLISELEYRKNELSDLDNAVTSDKNSSPIDIDFNSLVSKAISTAKSEIYWTPTFKMQLGHLPPTNSNPVDIFQIVLKLFRQSIDSVSDGTNTLSLFIKTWSTDNYINLYMIINGSDDLEKVYSGKGMTVVQELISQNNMSIEMKVLPDSNGSIQLRLPHTVI